MNLEDDVNSAAHRLANELCVVSNLAEELKNIDPTFDYEQFIKSYKEAAKIAISATSTFNPEDRKLITQASIAQEQDCQQAFETDLSPELSPQSLEQLPNERSLHDQSPQLPVND